MNRVLVIGCGKMARAVIPLLARNPEFFREICVSGRSKEKCDTYKKKYSSDKQKIVTAFVDINNKEKTRLMAKIYNPDLVINLAPSYLNLKVMDLCLEIEANYLDASLYIPKGSTQCDINAEYAYDQKFREKGLTAIIGCGFNPGVMNAFGQYAAGKLLDEISKVDIIDMNAGTNAHPYLMNTPMNTSLRQISSEGRMFTDGKIISVPPLSVQAKYSFPEIGKRNLFMVDHEVIDALSTELPGLPTIRYFSGFKRTFMSMVKVLRDVGMTSTTPVDIDGQQIAPLDFLYEVMPQQDDLAATAKGKTGIGMLVTGAVEGEKKQELIYALVDHQQCYEEFGASATDFMSAAALVSGANMIVTGQWKQDGVHMISEFDPQPFLKELKRQGLDYKVLEEAPDLEVSEHGTEEEAE
ncbi:MAG: saccharopine dehydrogenase NADP-binding domain-containing protein [Clostridiales bacterium]|nr:saccharopine dehydrogenase NADP-binding domain-containing protein [Candidatus Scatonaster coprocaballi]